MLPVPESPQPLFSSLSTLSTPLGNLNFSPLVSKRKIGQGWGTWSHGYTGDVYFNQGWTTTTITLPAGVTAFDFYLEPNAFNLFNIAVTAINQGQTTTLSQRISGNGDAKYFGFYTSDQNMLAKIVITDSSGGQAAGFAIGQMRIASKAFPEPASALGVFTVGILAIHMRCKRR